MTEHRNWKIKYQEKYFWVWLLCMVLTGNKQTGNTSFERTIFLESP